MKSSFFCVAASVLVASCSLSTAPAPQVFAVGETSPVLSEDDAADDPAIWINRNNPSASLILGTDKQAGLYIYDLKGEVRQFLPAGRLNNVDVRQDVVIDGWSGDIAAASNRTDDTVTLFAIEAGQVVETGRFPSLITEPYGLCMGETSDGVFVFVAFKTGDLIAFRLSGPGGGAEAARLKFDTQLEGCVLDDGAGVLYVGEEARGIWKTGFDGTGFATPRLVDEVRTASGMAADVEGLTIYDSGDGRGYLIASSQGNNSYAVYRREGENEFITRFRIAAGDLIDGAEETDGIAVTSASLGDEFPAGIFIAQDGYNAPRGTPQNFKIVDFRDIKAVIGAADTGERN